MNQVESPPDCNESLRHDIAHQTRPSIATKQFMVHGMFLTNATTIANTIANAIANTNPNAYSGDFAFQRKSALIRKRHEPFKCEQTNVFEATSTSMAKNMQCHAAHWRNRGAPSQRSFSLIDDHQRSTRMYLLRKHFAIPAKATCQHRAESCDISC